MRIYIPILLLVSIFGCSVKYSFSGKSISPDVKTFTVNYIQNKAAKAPATVSDIFTEGLKDKFRSESGLNLKNKNGDLEFEGSIVEYSTKYEGVTGDQVAAQIRLTIVVDITFINRIEMNKDFQKKFSAYRDFDAQLSLTDVEDQLIEEISEQIIEEIFMKAVADW